MTSINEKIQKAYEEMYETEKRIAKTRNTIIIESAFMISFAISFISILFYIPFLVNK